MQKDPLGRILSVPRLFDAFVLGVVLLLSVLLFKALPYHLETATFIVNSTMALVERQFQPLALIESGSAHPPGFMIYLAQVWHLFGDSLKVTHASMIPFFVGFIYSSYLLFKKLVKLELAVVASLSLAFVSSVITQYQLISIDLSVACFTTAAIAAWFYRRYLLSMILLSFGILFSWVAILVYPGLILAWWLQKRHVDYRVLLLPAATYIGWVFYQGISMGWWLVSPEIGFSLPPDLATFVDYLQYIVLNLTVYQALWLLTPISLLSSGYLLLKDRASLDNTTTQVLAIVLPALILGVGYFSINGSFTQFRITFLLPLILLLFITLVPALSIKLLHRDWSWLVLLLVLSFAFGNVTMWRVNRLSGANLYFLPDTNLAYQDTIDLFRQVAVFLEGSYPEAQIVAAYPEAYQIVQPFQGYINTSLNFLPCDQFEFDGNLTQILYIHPYHVSQLECSRLLNVYNTLPLKQFESGGKWLELFTIESTKSASPSSLLP